jgi:hypothetical protein
LDEVGGPSAIDEMAANPGIYEGTPSFTEAGAEASAPLTVLGSSVGFSGDDVVVVESSASLEGLTGDVSFELWLRPTDFSERRNPLAKAYGGEGTITQETDGRLTFFHGTSGVNGGPYEWFRTESSLPLGVWSHVVVTRQGNTVRWFINGVLDSEFTSLLSPVSSSLPLTIGDGYVKGFVGGIDEVAVYGSALTAAEVQAHYEAISDAGVYGSLVVGDGPVSYWRLDEVGGPSAIDEMAANPGIYEGTPSFTEDGATGP